MGCRSRAQRRFRLGKPLRLLTRTNVGDDHGVPYHARHKKACASHAENSPNGVDEPSASSGNVHLGEAITCAVKSHQIVHTKQQSDRQFRELGRTNDHARELPLDISRNRCFNASRIRHLSEYDSLGTVACKCRRSFPAYLQIGRRERRRGFSLSGRLRTDLFQGETHLRRMETGVAEGRLVTNAQSDPRSPTESRAAPACR